MPRGAIRILYVSDKRRPVTAFHPPRIHSIRADSAAPLASSHGVISAGLPEHAGDDNKKEGPSHMTVDCVCVCVDRQQS